MGSPAHPACQTAGHAGLRPDAGGPQPSWRSAITTGDVREIRRYSFRMQRVGCAARSRWRRRALALFAVAGLVEPAAGEGLARHLAESPQLLGDAGGARPWLDARGVSIDLFWNHELGLLVHGDEAGEGAQSGSADLFVRADLARLGVPIGGNALLQLKSNYGRNVNDEVAALGDPIDDADFDEAIYVDQLWWERGFAGERLRARIGFLDQQAAFDRNAFANNEDRQFLHTFLDNSPIVPLEIGIGALLVATPARWLELAVGVSDADNRVRRLGLDKAFDGADSWTTVAEATLRGSLGEGRPGALRLGAFRDGEEKAVFGRAARSRGHLGAYLGADLRVLPEAGDASQGLGVFARAGVADGRTNRIAGFWSAGLEWAGALPGRDRDALGAAVYQTLPSDAYRDRVDPDFSSETGVEIYYRVQLTPWLALTPDAQWIRDPGGSDAARDAVLFVLRLRVAL